MTRETRREFLVRKYSRVASEIIYDGESFRGAEREIVVASINRQMHSREDVPSSSRRLRRRKLIFVGYRVAHTGARESTGLSLPLQ